MLKLSIKPIWIATFALLGALVIAMKLAMAYPTFVPGNQPIGYLGQDDVTNYNLTSGSSILYRGQYERSYWGGNLIAYVMPASGDITTALPLWNSGAAYQIDKQPWDSAATPTDVNFPTRIIVSRNTSGTNIPFNWASLDATQKTAIDSANAGNSSSSILNFLRGNRTDEVQQGGTLRQRGTVLGDIVHSRPYYLNDVTSTTPAPTVFIGANDGMLHAINAINGTERWAYVPSMLIPKIKKLSVDNSPAAFTHDYYVDGSVMVASIKGDTQRVVVGALGAGGKGLFALDITGDKLAPTSETTAASNILWEITNSTTGFANLGDTYANPSIAKVVSTGTVAAGKDAVIVGNGYNNTGDGEAYLYIIDATDPSKYSAIKAVASGATPGSSGSPNGLSTPVAIDTNNDGIVDTVYAGDVNGTMWKFDLASSTATALLITNPRQPITMTPGVARHPNGGFMINFATGAMLTSADASDTATIFSAYGVWDGAPAANTAWLSQTLTERCYTPGTTSAATPCAQRVRTVTANVPDWTSGATHHKAWKVALPAGEKVVGDGSFIENSRFYFTSSNPNIANTVQTSTVKGENWLMELDYLSGGVQNSPFLDLSGDHSITDDDRVKNSASPPVAVTTTDGIPVGKVVGIGVMSQPILVQLSSLNNTLFNQNPDITIVPVVLGSGAGVTGGHFDIDIFYAVAVSGAQAQATITVGNGSSSSGQTSGYPATLGAITVDGVTIVPALTVNDIPDGASSNYTNAKTITSMVTGGFTATRSNGVITIKAPAGTQFNGKAISIEHGTSQTLVVAKAAVVAVTGVTGQAPSPGTLVITAVNKDETASIKCGNTYIGTTGNFTTSDSDSASTRLNDLYSTINKSVNGYTISCIKGGSPTSSLTCTISAPIGASACSSGFNVDSSIKKSTNTGPSGGVNAVTAVTGSDATLKSGWTDFYPAVTAISFNNNGVDAASVGDTCADTTCKYDTHFHQYDDVYDVTGLNVLNPSSATVNIKLGIPSLTQNFKVIVQNQYLSPAVKLHIGDPSYLYNVDFGYITLKNYSTWTTSTAQLESLQTYRRDPNTVWPYTTVAKADLTDAMRALPKPIGSFAFNMPLDALTPKDWWGGTTPDVRVGLHPIQPQCMWQAEGTHDGNMYKPVIPPVNGVAGPGTKGWTNSTTPTTATGARHGGALIFQIIKDTTPNAALEMNVANRPEYGWRVKSELYSQYVLEEYGTYWHHPNGKCFYDSGWTKTPPADNGSSSLSNKAVGSTDPHIGNLSVGSVGGGTILTVTTTVVGNVTTTVITYTVGANATIVRTVNDDGSATIVTTDTLGVRTTQTVANTDGSLKTGGDERGSGVAKTGRISWRELVAP